MPVSLTVFLVFVALVPYVFHSLGRSPAEYGLWYLSISGGYFAGNWVVSRYAYTLGVQRLIHAGVALQAAAAAAGWALALGGLWHPFWLFAPWAVIGFAQGLALPNLTASAADPRFVAVLPAPRLHDRDRRRAGAGRSRCPAPRAPSPGGRGPATRS